MVPVGTIKHIFLNQKKQLYNTGVFDPENNYNILMYFVYLYMKYRQRPKTPPPLTFSYNRDV